MIRIMAPIFQSTEAAIVDSLHSEVKSELGQRVYFGSVMQFLNHLPISGAIHMSMQ